MGSFSPKIEETTIFFSFKAHGAQRSSTHNLWERAQITSSVSTVEDMQVFVANHFKSVYTTHLMIANTKYLLWYLCIIRAFM
mmetsp:Transcript_35358/g.105634  ORF Transcript_35358/g.105634 Transcript_35358/m.105634 type:complete len:82 (-) Transcript_35358:90-335(-)